MQGLSPAPFIKCNLCGTIWDTHTGKHLRCFHSDADWDQWRKAQGVPDGQNYARYTPLDADKNPIQPPPPPGQR